MRRYQTKVFAKWARKERLKDGDLVRAALEMDRGLVDATLGKALVKKRVARSGGGKSGGYRTIVMFRAATRLIFLYGFPKNAKSTLTERELEAYLTLARIFDGKTQAEIDALCETGELKEIGSDE